MFYSNLANVTIYPTPIYATRPITRTRSSIMLNRIVPDDHCRIRLQQNRFKYRRIAVAQKLVELADQGCSVSVVSFQDDLRVNRLTHCQQYHPRLSADPRHRSRLPTATSKWAGPSRTTRRSWSTR